MYYRIREKKDIAIKYCRKAIKKFKIPGYDLFCNFGNHDDNSYLQNDKTAILTDNEILRFLRNSSKYKIIYCTPFTYYYDHDVDKIRYIFINSGKRNLSEIEFNFIAESLLNTPCGYKIVISGHIWTEWNGKVHIPNKETQQLLDMFDSFNSRAKYKTYDFSYIDSSILLILGGHIHNDRIIYTNEGTPVVTTNSDAWKKACGKGTIERFTPTEQCFDVFLLENNQIRIIRIGHGSDRLIKI